MGPRYSSTFNDPINYPITRSPDYQTPLSDRLVEREDRIDIDRHVARGVEPLPQRRRHRVVLLEPCLGARAVAGRFLLEQLLRELLDRGRHLRVLDAIAAAGADDGALCGEV